MTQEGNDSGEFEYCPRCDANLTLQKGYSNELPYWICKGCGEMLINPLVEGDTAWFCDGCGAMLNLQEGFSEDCGSFNCKECGFLNVIDAGNLYVSEDEYQAEQSNPYKGLPDEAVLALSLYSEEAYLSDREDILLVRDAETGERFVKKYLTIYDRSIYAFLQAHPVANMPKIRELYEGDNCLIVIEEYIPGLTLSALLEEGALSEARAVKLAIGLCRILMQLHAFPTPIIHRDVKPANVIINPFGEVFLLDMNVAKWYDSDTTDDTRHMGTQYYAAPEQAGYGLQSSTVKADIYAMGILLNVMLTGAFPKEKRAEGRLWRLIERCIRLEAAERYTAEELLAELEKLAD